MTELGTTLDPGTARVMWQATEPVHAMAYFTAEPQEEYAAIGLDRTVNPAHGYFPARAAAMGPVPWQVVQSTFFNFSAFVCQLGIDGVWDIASPTEVLAARHRGVERALTRLCGDLLDDTSALAEAAELAREAALGCTVEGRPLYAAHASLPWPESPLLQLWHAISLLREFRGDGHIAAMVCQGLTGIEGAVLHVVQGDLWSRRALQATRGYSDEQYDAAVARLVDRGWLDEAGAFTDAGRAARQEVEDRTDVLALPGWERLGAQGCARLRELVTPLSEAVLDGGGMPVMRKPAPPAADRG